MRRPRSRADGDRSVSNALPANDDVIAVNFVEFASIPDVDGEAARMMLLVDEPGTRRLFVNDMRGPLYSVSYDGKTVTPYLDINAPAWGVSVNSVGLRARVSELRVSSAVQPARTPRLRQVLHLHRHEQQEPHADFVPGGGNNTHDTVLLEWTAKNPAAATYDGGPPRELMRFEQPFANHNGGHLAFNPLATPRDADFGLLYIGSADGGSGGDPLEARAESQVGLRQAPAHRSARLEQRERQVRHSASNPFVKDGDPTTLGEIYAYGPAQSTALRVGPEERQPVRRRHRSEHRRGDQTGHRRRQPRLEQLGRQLRLLNRAGSASTTPAAIRITYPVVEYGQLDPLLQPQFGGHGRVRISQNAIPQLDGLLLFGDNPSGEMFYINADKLPNGRAGSDPPDSLQRQRRVKDAAGADQGEERQARQAAGHPRRSALRKGPTVRSLS